jgi:diacylglycerol O-acyltransferase
MVQHERDKARPGREEARVARWPVTAPETAMSDSDALLWTIGRDPVLRTTICAVLVLDCPPDWEELRKRFAALAEDVPKLRSHVVGPGIGQRRPRWVADRTFDLDLHLHRVSAAPPGDLRTVLDLAQGMATMAFDPELPLWESVLVGGLDGGDGEPAAALVIKLHHAVVDGIGGIAVALRLLDRERIPSPVTDTGHASGPGTNGSGAGLGIAGRAVAGRAVAGRAAGMARSITRFAGHAATHPTEALDQARATATSVGKLLAPSPHPLSSVMTGRSLLRHFEVIDLDLGRMRSVARAAGASLNDVFVAGALGGLRHYHQAHGARSSHLRVLMPVSVRADGDVDSGNRFVPARFVLPVDPDPGVRVRDVHREAGAWKSAPALGLSDVLAAGLDLLPPAAATSLWGSMLKGNDFCATNVPGPPFETYLAGGRVERFYAFAPPSGAALNIALVTPAGRACVGVNVDPAAVPDTSVLTACLRRGFAEVLEGSASEGPVSDGAGVT